MIFGQICRAGGASLGLVRNPPWRRAGEGIKAVLCSGEGADRQYAPVAADAGDERETFLGGDGAAQQGAPTAADDPAAPSERYSHLRTLRVGLIMTPLWFLANCSYQLQEMFVSSTSFNCPCFGVHV